MHNEELLSGRGRVKHAEDIKRMHLLAWRFSAAEIDRLIHWQTLYQGGPMAPDLSLEECRMRFVRWLVEHGRLGEEGGVALEVLDGEHSSSLPLQGARAVSQDAPPRYRDPPTRRGDHKERRVWWCPPFLMLASRLKQGFARATAQLRAAARSELADCRSDWGGAWGQPGGMRSST